MRISKAFIYKYFFLLVLFFLLRLPYFDSEAFSVLEHRTGERLSRFMGSGGELGGSGGGEMWP